MEEHRDNGIVCVTGVTGFVASWTVKFLLDAGYHVHGTVRSVKNVDLDLYTYLDNERVTLFEADLMGDVQSFRDAMAGCDYVLHIASPCMLIAEDPQRDLIDPAVSGTKLVMQAAKDVSTVKKVILTSSFCAVADHAIEGKTYTEADWNEDSHVGRLAYFASKAQAEKAAWDFMEENDVDFELLAVNPYIIVGPRLFKKPLAYDCNTFVSQFLNGATPVIADLLWGLTDVRDVALAHIALMENDQAEGRYLTVADMIHLRDICDVLREAYPDRNVPTQELEYSPELLQSFGDNEFGTLTRNFYATNYNVSNAKSLDAGIQYRNLRDTIIDTAEWALANDL